MRRALGLLGLLLAPGAGAADLDDLLGVLAQARTWEVRGVAQVTVNFPPRTPPTRAANRLPTLPVRPALLARNFNVVRVGPELQVGRTVTRYDLTPKAGNAARWVVWVDQAWNLPLAFEERGADGAVARRALFTKVNPSPVKAAVKVPAVPRGLGAAVARALPGLRLPPGFTPVALRPAGNRWEVTLSDGLNTLALVTAARDVQAAPGVASRRVGAAFVWLTGNLPAADLTAALSGVRQVRPAELGTFFADLSSNP